MKALTRRELFAAPLLAAMLPGGWAAQTFLPQPRSLAAALEAALVRRRALVLMVSRPACPWCKLVRESYLAPIFAKGQPVVELDMQDSGGMVGFDGAATSPARAAESLGVRMAPTVLFIGREGRELAPRLTGVSSVDFYGAYLDDRIGKANQAVG